IVGVSRLEALATLAAPTAEGEFVAAFTNAQRKQIFGALYWCDGVDGQTKREEEHRPFAAQGQQESLCRLRRIGEEAVLSRDEFVTWVGEKSGGSPVRWISTDPEMLIETDATAGRQNGDAARLLENGSNT